MSNNLSLSEQQSIFRQEQTSGQARPARQARKKTPVVPATLFEIQQGFVLGARLARSGHKVGRLCVRELEPGVVVPSAGRTNIEKPEKIEQALHAVAETIGNGTGPVGLLVPDGIVRVSILEFENLPADSKEQEALIRWKMKPALPFPPEEARLSYEISLQEPKRTEVLVAAVRNAVLAEYEALIEKLNGDVRLVLPATAALLPLLSADSGQGELLLHATTGGLAAAVVQGQRLRLWRSQQISWVSQEDWLQKAAQEASRMLASAQDHLQLEIGRISLCTRPVESPNLAAELAQGISQPVETLGASWQFAEKLSAPEELLFENFGAALAGLLANTV